MKRALWLGVLAVSAVLLAGCETLAPNQASVSGQVTDGAAAPTGAPAAEEQLAAVAVLLADTSSQDGWQTVRLSDGVLYLNPDPVLTHSELTGVLAGTNKNGDGVLVLQLSEEGRGRLVQATTGNPGKRLALIVGETLMAVPAYSAPLTSDQLSFMVGTGENAVAAARAITGNGP